MTMETVFILAAILGSCTATGCPRPSKMGEEVQTCVASLMKFTGLSDCPSLEEGLDCMEDLVDSCKDSPALAGQYTFLKEQLTENRNNFNMFCSKTTHEQNTVPTDNGEKVCPSPRRLHEEIQRCTEHMMEIVKASDHASKCSSLQKGLDCMEDIVHACKDSPALGGQFTFLKKQLTENRNNFNKLCSQTNYERNQSNQDDNERNLTCSPPKRVDKEIRSCNKHMMEFVKASDASTCSSFKGGLDCVNNIVDECNGSPILQDVHGTNRYSYFKYRIKLIRKDYDEVCSTAQEQQPHKTTHGNNVESTCPPPEKVQTCIKHVVTFVDQEASDRDSKCPSLKNGVDCMSEALRACNNTDRGYERYRMMQIIEDYDELCRFWDEQWQPLWTTRVVIILSAWSAHSIVPATSGGDTEDPITDDSNTDDTNSHKGGSSMGATSSLLLVFTTCLLSLWYKT